MFGSLRADTLADAKVVLELGGRKHEAHLVSERPPEGNRYPFGWE